MTNIQKETTSGFIWMTIGKIGSGAMIFLVSIILARLLIPDDFALVALLTIFITISQALTDSGFSQALIRVDKVKNIDYSSVFYFNLIFSVLLYVILFFTAPLIADFFSAPKLLILSRVAFLVIPFNAFTLVPNVILYRKLQFNKISFSNIYAMFLAGSISIASAFAGFGVWAILINLVLQSVFNAIFLLKYAQWKPIVAFSWKALNKYLSFGIFLLLQHLYDVIVMNLNSFVIGRLYTKTELGYYSQGGSLIGYFIDPLIKVIQKVTYPITSKVKDDEKNFKSTYLSLYQLMYLIFIPISVFLIINSTEIILLLFGEKWEKASVFLKIASFSGLFYPIQVLSENVIMVKGKSKQLLFLSIFRQTLRLVAILIFLKKGVIFLACIYTLTGIIGGLSSSIYSMYLLSYRFKSVVLHTSKVLIAVFLACLSIYLIRNVFSILIIQVIFDVFVYGIVVLLCSYVLKNPTIELIINIFRNK